ncbi:MAG: ATP-binding cassette domain-containing protein [Halanaerobiales bacterium]|nr:ATP-binding cassette domain-containing protein [Halanaerobiales bacterium]
MTEQNTILSVKEIVKVYGDHRAVDNISFKVKRGEIFGLLGPNGAGKTTTIRMLMGITAPDEGNIQYYFNKTCKVKKNVGYLPEDRGIYQTTKVLESIIYFGQLKGLEHKEVKESALNWLDRLGLKSYANKKIEELSKGMQQKVQFIISVIHRPEFVVLDEVFAGLDPVNQDVFKEIVRSLASEGTTVLLSSHRMNLVEELCDRIFLINKGKQVLYGNLSEIKEKFGEEKVSVRYQGDLSFIKNHAYVRDLKVRSGQVEFYLAPEMTPDQFIRQIPENLQIRELTIVKPPLHDIFVRTVKEGD